MVSEVLMPLAKGKSAQSNEKLVKGCVLITALSRNTRRSCVNLWILSGHLGAPHTMQDILSLMSSLRRPRLLMRAARLGVSDYNRDRHLRAILGAHKLPRPGDALMQLMAREGAMEEDRAAEAADYTFHEHVKVLIAMLGEARLLRAAQLAARQKAAAATGDSISDESVRL